MSIQIVLTITIRSLLKEINFLKIFFALLHLVHLYGLFRLLRSRKNTFAIIDQELWVIWGKMLLYIFALTTFQIDCNCEEMGNNPWSIDHK